MAWVLGIIRRWGRFGSLGALVLGMGGSQEIDLGLALGLGLGESPDTYERHQHDNGDVGV